MPAFDNRIDVFFPGDGEFNTCPTGMCHVPWITRAFSRPFEPVDHARQSLLQEALYFPLAVCIAKHWRVSEEVAIFPGRFQAEDAPVILVESGIALGARRPAADRDRRLAPAASSAKVAIGRAHHSCWKEVDISFCDDAAGEPQAAGPVPQRALRERVVICS